MCFVVAADLSAFRPSSFYIVINLKVGIRVLVQLSPVMQVFVSADSSLKGSTAGMSPYYCVSIWKTPPASLHLPTFTNELTSSDILSVRFWFVIVNC